MEAILNSATNEEALAAVRKEFPDANTTKASINWYRNKLRKDGAICTDGAYKGKPVPNAREMAKDAKPAEAPAVQTALAQAQAAVQGRGRAFLRPSGTEPVVRVTVEADDAALMQSTLDQLADAVRAAAA